MRPIALLVFLFLLVGLISCMDDHGTATTGQKQEWPAGLQERSPGSDRVAFEFDIIQRTCALFTAMRSAAFEGPIEFGREVDDGMVHWNRCPSGNAIACASVSTATDSVQAGIPWPHSGGW